MNHKMPQTVRELLVEKGANRPPVREANVNPMPHRLVRTRTRGKGRTVNRLASESSVPMGKTISKSSKNSCKKIRIPQPIAKERRHLKQPVRDNPAPRRLRTTIQNRGKSRPRLTLPSPTPTNRNQVHHAATKPTKRLRPILR